MKVSIETATDLVEAGLAEMVDVMAPLGQGQADHVDVLLRLTNLTEFAAPFRAYVDGPWSE